jgi:hypothetical protein
MISPETRELAVAIEKAIAEDRRANTLLLISRASGAGAMISGAVFGLVGPFAPYYPAVALGVTITWLLLTAMVRVVGKGWAGVKLWPVALAIVVGFYFGEALAEAIVTMFSNGPYPSGTYISPFGDLPVIP